MSLIPLRRQIAAHPIHPAPASDPTGPSRSKHHHESSLAAKPESLAVRPAGAGIGSLRYSLSCLGLVAILIEACVTLAPQLSHAEDSAGIYEFIHMNAALSARAPRPEQNLRLPQLSLRRPMGRANVIPARLPPERRAVAARRSPAVSEPTTCATCEATRFSSPLDAILRDPTLRAGDIVMTNKGAMVFRGANHLPHTAGDFTDFRQSTLLTKEERRRIDDAVGPTADASGAFEGKGQASRPPLELADPRAMRAFFPTPGPVTQAAW